jgi:hypothetical protein
VTQDRAGIAKRAGELLDALRSARPLVQNITNFVSMDTAANALLALGASPAMVHSAEESGDFAVRADSLVVNTGTLSQPFLEGGETAATAAHMLGRPWVLDPVGVGGGKFRNEAVLRLLRHRLGDSVSPHDAVAEAMQLMGPQGLLATAAKLLGRVAIPAGLTRDTRHDLAKSEGLPLLIKLKPPRPTTAKHARCRKRAPRLRRNWQQRSPKPCRAWACKVVALRWFWTSSINRPPVAWSRCSFWWQVTRAARLVRSAKWLRAASCLALLWPLQSQPAN